MSAEPLACPSCATTHPLSERFCPRCGMPLVYVGALGADQPVTEAHERARKILPQYTEGEPVKVAYARNQAEAEFVQGLLLEEGIPSMLRRARGFDVPDFMAAGPRDVLVPQSGVQAAREVLLEAGIAGTQEIAGPRPAYVLGALLAGLAVIAVIVLAGTGAL